MYFPLIIIQSSSGLKIKTGAFSQNVCKAFWSQSCYQRTLFSTSSQFVMLALHTKHDLAMLHWKTWSRFLCTQEQLSIYVIDLPRIWNSNWFL